MQKILEWKQTQAGLATTGVIELVLAYVFGSLAIDTGSYWHYLLSFVLLAGFIHSLVRAIKSHGKK